MSAWLLRALCACLCSGVLFAATRSAMSSRQMLQSARTTHAEAEHVAQRLASARGASSSVLSATGDAQGAMVARVSTSLTRAGIPVSRMTSLSPGSAAAASSSIRLSDGTTVRQVRCSVSISLDQVSLPELGGFLQAWRTEQPEWRVTSLQATPVPLRPGDLPAGKALPGNVLARPLAIHLTVETSGIEREVTP